MVRWEYLVLNRAYDGSCRSVQRASAGEVEQTYADFLYALDRLGRDGWQLVMEAGSEMVSHQRYIFMRPLE